MEENDVLVSRTITIDLEDMIRIEEKIMEGKFKSVSHFVQNAVKKELEGENHV